jgi:hypothetical protein
MKRFLPLSFAAKALLLLVLVIGWQQVFSQAARIDFKSEPTSAEVKVNDFQRTKIDFKFQGLNAVEVSTERGTFSELFLDLGYSIGELGTPKLPAEKHLIEIPFGAEVEVSVVRYSTTEYRLADFGIDNLLMPVQPSLRKDMEASQVPFEYKAESFSKNAFTENPIAEIEVLGVMRGMRIARLTVAPVQYNPAQGTIKVHNDIELEIRYTGADIALTNHVKASTFSPYFDVVYGKMLNPLGLKNVYDDHPDLTKNPVKMVVVSNRMFEETLQPYLEWKTQQGFFLTVGYTDEIGTTATAIKNFIHAQYNAATPDDPAPTFIVLVGDPATMPASAIGSSSNQVTDLYYASVDGDYFPEMYYGRLSARNVQELQNQLDKILYYEKYEFTDPSYLNDATLIAGQDGTWNPAVGQPTIKYGTANYFNAAHGFNTVWGYGVANDPNNPNNNSGYTGCYDDTRISVSLVNFTAHCSPTSWAGPYLTVADVHNMTNAGKYPLAIGNCCQSSMFSQPESIGEAWLRAANKGGVAYIGSAPNTYWFEDFYWSVGAFPISGNNNGYVPTFDQTTMGAYDAPFVSDYLSVAALKFVGNLAVTEVNVQGYPSHSSPLYYWQAYHTFGDPSTFIYLTEGEENQVTHMPIVPIGLDTYIVQALPGSYVAISKDGVLHGAAFVDETGEVEVPIEPILDGGDVRIVVTKHQFIPYIVDIPAAALEGPYVVLDSFIINDNSGNDNGEPDFGESFTLHITLKNVGADPGLSISATVTGTDPYFTATNSGPASFGDISAGETGNTATVDNAFAFSLASNVPDQYKATFVVNITDGEETWQSNLRLTANAPVLVIGGISIDDGGEGIPGVLDPGETANAVIQVSNTGHSDAPSIEALLTTSSPFITINGDATLPLGPLAAGTSTTATYSISADEETPLETAAILNLALEAGEYQAEKDLEVIIGYIPEYNMSNTNVTACIGRFYDTGGATGDYSNSENITMTFFPASEDATLMFVFSAFNTELNYDKLFIYDGANTSAPQFPGSPFMGTVSPGMIMATNEDGAITFNFTSDGSVVRPGWEAEFHCVDLSNPPDCASNPSPAVGEVVGLSPVTLSWSFVPGALQYDVYIGQNTLPTEPTTTVSTNSYGFTVQPHTNYVWMVVPKNDAGEAVGCPTWNFSTSDIATNLLMHAGTATTCNSLFYDSGGPNGSYQNSENYTLKVYPESPAGKVKISFLEFDVENNYDFLKIYNGTSATAPLLANLTGTSLPGNFVANNNDGALTFVFTSDGSITKPGWKAHLTCEYVGQEVTFAVTDETEQPIEGALLTIAQTETYTNSQGIAVVVLAGNNSYPWTISKAGYFPANGVAEVLEAPLSVDVELLKIPEYNVTFTVADTNGEPLEGASIEIAQTAITTDANGVAEIDLPSDTYAWTASMIGYVSETGVVSVEDDDTQVSVALTIIRYNVTFTVVNVEHAPIPNAEIILEGYGTQTTDAEGEATFTEVAPGNDMPYSVTHDNYFSYAGTLNVSLDHVQMEIEMVVDDTSVSELTEGLHLLVYPNPTRGQVNVRFNTHGKSAVVTLTNYQGQVISREMLNPVAGETRHLLNLNGFAQGIYYLKVEAGDSTRIEKIILQ